MTRKLVLFESVMLVMDESKARLLLPAPSSRMPALTNPSSVAVPVIARACAPLMVVVPPAPVMNAVPEVQIPCAVEAADSVG